MFRVQQDNEGEFQSWALSELCDWWMVRCELPKKWREIAHMSLRQKCHNDYQISKVINTPEGGSIRFLVATCITLSRNKTLESTLTSLMTDDLFQSRVSMTLTKVTNASLLLPII
jgi:hypothetical protein